MSDPRTKLVGDGYDAMIDTWESWSARVTDDPRHEWSADLATRLPQGARVLELGCGGGTRETRELAARFELTGVDLSERQLERARERVPGATFVHGDLTNIEFDAGSFDAVVSFYVFNHVPRDLLAPLLARAHRWLTEGGYLMAVFGASEGPATSSARRRTSRASRRTSTAGSSPTPASRSSGTSPSRSPSRKGP